MDKTQLTFDEFQDIARGCETIPVYKQILADLLTPVAAWVHLSKKAEYAFLLESVEKGNQYSRYSYVGINPQKILNHKDGQSSIAENRKSIYVDTPIVVGFGISTRNDVVWFNEHSDGAVVGSAIIKNMEGESDPVNATELLIQNLKGTL